ncbi:nicotinamidase [Desulfothermus okinawensis JCM 13304]
MDIVFEPKDVLLLVDIQIDFCPGGKLSIKGGDEIVPILNPVIEQAEKDGIYVFYSRDFHPRLHPSFKENGGLWPTHCVQDTEGAKFHPDLRIAEKSIIVTKGTRFDKDQYSAFDETGLAFAFKKLKIKRVFIAGLALDVCVKATAIDSMDNGFDTYLIREGSRPVSEKSGEKALAEMKNKGIVII